MNLSYHNTSNVALKIVLINIVVFIIQQVHPLYYLFALTPDLIVGEYMVWQLGTYMFLHGNFMHIFFNMYALLICGVALESVWGSKKFLIYYFFTGIGAGISIFLLNYFTGNGNIPTLGASGAIFGILIAFAIYFPDAQFLFMFIIPMRAIYFVFILISIEIVYLLNGGQSGISNIGHVGGFVFGLIFLVLFDKDKKAFKIGSKSKKNVNKISKSAVGDRKVFTDESELTKKNILEKLEKNSDIEALSDDEVQYIRYLDIMIKPADLLNYSYDKSKKITDSVFLALVKKYIDI